MDEVKLWNIGPEREVTLLESVAQVESEWSLETVLVENPSLLEQGVELVGRQTQTANGWLDLLGVDVDGRLVVYELKRGTVGREAVAQALDYASYLSEMDLNELADHIAGRSGQGGIQEISNFSDWYEERFGDMQRLKPIRIALVGLGIDDVAIRVAHFLADRAVEIEAITFYGFLQEGSTLLARQLPVQAPSISSGASTSVPIAERRRRLNAYLEQCGLTRQFNAVRDALLERIPTGVFVDARQNGVSLQMSVTNQNGKRGPYPYFGIYAAYTTSDAIEISLNTITERRNSADLERLADHVTLTNWRHGGKAIIVNGADDWDDIEPHVCEFATSVYESWLEYRHTPMDHSIVE